jgi:hypothetical protein
MNPNVILGDVIPSFVQHKKHSFYFTNYPNKEILFEKIEKKPGHYGFSTRKAKIIGEQITKDMDIITEKIGLNKVDLKEDWKFIKKKICHRIY